MVELISIVVLWSLCPSKIHVPSQIFCFSNYMLWSQKLKICSKLSEWNCAEIFSPQMFASWCDILNEGINKLTRRKHFLWQKFLLRDVCVGNVSITHRVHLFHFHFMESYRLFNNFQVIFNVPIWVLLILGAHLFSWGSQEPVHLKSVYKILL